ncbi:MAG: enoyl-CoA hydratase/isomerase family protein [Deltaproteobacteria bacterium]|nr:enoyl-CoA hydratase/isomerase family protein [Deltaproteobacteria bacterium]
METLRFDRTGHVGWLWLNRPQKLNAMTAQMWDELRELGQTLRDDPDLRALVVIGEGRSFSTGIDTSQFGGDLLGSSSQPSKVGAADDPVVTAILRTQEAFTWLEETPYPTIAAVRGHALGAGMQLALACDMRVVARSAQFGLLEHRYGLVPDLGGTQRLPRLVGAGKAKELIFTAKIIDAEEAQRLGMIEQLVEDEALESAATTLAETIAAQPPLAVRYAKRAINAALDTPIRQGLRLEAEGQAVCLRSEDFKAAIRAYKERQVPQYKGR